LARADRSGDRRGRAAGGAPGARPGAIGHRSAPAIGAGDGAGAMIRAIVPRRLAAAVAGLVAPCILDLAPAGAVEIQRVVSPMGIEAWLVESDAVPVIAMEFAFLGGSASDPVGKEGLANLVSTLLDEGAGELDSATFQQRLADAAINLNFDAGTDAFYG